MNQRMLVFLSQILCITGALLAISPTPTWAKAVTFNRQSPKMPAQNGSALLTQRQKGWDTFLKMGSVFNAQQEAIGIIIQLDILEKPPTTYANAVYQLFTRRDGKWVSIYTSEGARLIENEAGQLSLEGEVIPITQVQQVLGNLTTLENVDFKAVVKIRYDVPGQVRDQQYSVETEQTLTVKLPSATASETIETPSPAPTQPASSTPPNIGKGTFSLELFQPVATPPEKIVRLSVKERRSDGYSKERFIGDFRTPPNQRMQFLGGLAPGDRMVVRLYDLQNRLLGLSEFELLFAHAAVKLIVPADPASGVIRTAYGIDQNNDGMIDTSPVFYDYFTQVSKNEAGTWLVRFLTSLETINPTQLQVTDFVPPPNASIYPPPLAQGAYSLANATRLVYTPDLASAFTAKPGEVVKTQSIENATLPVYDIREILTQYQEQGVSQQIQVKFTDVPADYWASSFISELAAQNIFKGFPDGMFHPNETLSRAEFATILSKAFNLPKTRTPYNFPDVPANYWAAGAIGNAYEMGFFESGSFNPEQKLDRLDVMIILTRGLNYAAKRPTENSLTMYRDSESIPSEFRNLVAAATEYGLVVNYPDPKVLNPQKEVTRAEVAAFVYQALASLGKVAKVSSPYIAGTSQIEGQNEPNPR
jgi:hypothetical protein